MTIRRNPPPLLAIKLQLWLRLVVVLLLVLVQAGRRGRHGLCHLRVPAQPLQRDPVPGRVHRARVVLLLGISMYDVAALALGLALVLVHVLGLGLGLGLCLVLVLGLGLVLVVHQVRDEAPPPARGQPFLHPRPSTAAVLQRLLPRQCGRRSTVTVPQPRALPQPHALPQPPAQQLRHARLQRGRQPWLMRRLQDFFLPRQRCHTQVEPTVARLGSR